jgi:hypothetical protein
LDNLVSCRIWNHRCVIAIHQPHPVRDNESPKGTGGSLPLTHCKNNPCSDKSCSVAGASDDLVSCLIWNHRCGIAIHQPHHVHNNGSLKGTGGSLPLTHCKNNPCSNKSCSVAGALDGLVSCRERKDSSQVQHHQQEA